MNTREKFKRAVIESIHGLPYEEAIKKETLSHELINECRTALRLNEKVDFLFKEEREDYEKTLLKAEGRYLPSPITIGRVMQALHKKHDYFNSLPNLLFAKTEEFDLLGEWQLTKDGKELTDDDQSDVTIEALYKLLK